MSGDGMSADGMSADGTSAGLPASGDFDPAWLALRAPADAAARGTAVGALVGPLAAHLASVGARGGGSAAPVALVDVGAGTGAGARWLQHRLRERSAPVARWRLIDPDRGLLAAAAADGLAGADLVPAEVGALPELLAADPADVVTCQSLLDLLVPVEAEALVAAAAGCGAAVLLALTVTGGARFDPPDRDDAAVVAAFDAHQRRAGRLGPGGAAAAAAALAGRGYAVTVAPTPWRLGAGDAALLVAWLDGYAAAAAEQRPDAAGLVHRWHARRRAQAATGGLRAVVPHADVLGLPPGRRG